MVRSVFARAGRGGSVLALIAATFVSLPAEVASAQTATLPFCPLGEICLFVGKNYTGDELDLNASSGDITASISQVGSVYNHTVARWTLYRNVGALNPWLDICNGAHNADTSNGGTRSTTTKAAEKDSGSC